MSKLSRNKKKIKEDVTDKSQRKISFYVKKIPVNNVLSESRDISKPASVSVVKETSALQCKELISLVQEIDEIPPTPEPAIKSVKLSLVSKFRRTAGKAKLNDFDTGDEFTSLKSKTSFENISSFSPEKKKKKVSSIAQDDIDSDCIDIISTKKIHCSRTFDNLSGDINGANLFTKIVQKPNISRHSVAPPTEHPNNKKLQVDNFCVKGSNKIEDSPKKTPLTPKKKVLQNSVPHSPKANKPSLRRATPKKNSDVENNSLKLVTPKENSIVKYFSPKKSSDCTSTKINTPKKCKNKLEFSDSTSPSAVIPVLKVLSTINSLEKSNIVSSDALCSDSSIDWNDDFDFGNELSQPFEKLSPFKSKINIPIAKSYKFCIKAINRGYDFMDLSLSSKYDAYTRTCRLKGSWMDSTLKINDTVTIAADFDSTGLAVIDNDKGLFVMNPDLLVSSTSIASTLFCTRKSVLTEKFRGWDAGNEAMLLGNIIHELFQKVSQYEIESISKLKEELANILKSSSYLHELYGLGISVTAIEKKANTYLPSIFSWIKQYQSVTPSPLCRDSKNGSEDILAQVTDVHDIEENIWCTKYGVKGKIDVTLQVNLHKRATKETKIVPLELKTGKASFSTEHQGQVILYSLMLSDKLKDPGGGLLLYLADGPQMKFIEATHNKKRGLVQLRNELAHYFDLLKGNNGIKSCQLPDPITRFKFCENCPFLLPCTLMESDSKFVTNSNQRNQLIKTATQHIQPSHMSYFVKWYDLLQLEYANQCKKDGGNTFWTCSANEKEKSGTCFGNMKLSISDAQKIDDHFNHVFYRNGVSLIDVGISAGDLVVISSISSPNEIGLSMGSVSFVTANQVEVLLDKNLYKRNDAKSELFRIDLNYSSSAFSTNFKNLLKLMLKNEESEKLRKLVIDGEEPTFEKGLKRHLAEKLKPFVILLNNLQQRAILKLLMAKDYLLLHGMPGTGKTSTVVALVRVLAALGLSVLLTSYTHSAVDNILLKLSKFDVKFVRLGQESRIHTDIKKYSSGCLTKSMSSVEELQAFYSSIPVVATTCLGTNHAVFKQRRFDVCIVDEASQILQTTCFGPLYHAKVFVLVGDSKQLPPVVSSKEAKEQGLGESLFSKLESPSCTFELNIQYRMNCEIMRLCNELTYDGKLHCGSEVVSSATISLKKINLVNIGSWCQHVLSEELSQSVIFLNTDDTFTSEVQDATSVYNVTEVNITAYLAEKFIQAGLESSDLGIISFYKKQVLLLKHKCKSLSVEVNTVDQFQGRDKSVVIISCVRNSDGQAVSEIMQDERRLNVSLTRAKHKLVIVGSRRTLDKYKPFSRLMNILRQDQLVNLSANDLEIFGAS